MKADTYFTPDLFRFLRELKAHNERKWFEKNKERYLREARDPFLRLIGDLRPRLAAVSPHFVVDPSPVGGSMLRIYRDIRFSKDKSPYKTSIAAHFWHAHATEEARPAFYLHLEPHECLAGGGLWRPPAPGLKKIREAIVQHPAEWKKAVAGRSFQAGCGLMGESLKRPPAGFDPGHPFIHDIKRKDFATAVPIEESEVTGPDPLGRILDRFKSASPLIRFVTESLGLSY
jgi:uncharacterized protein (TIGR02453 family)